MAYKYFTEQLLNTDKLQLSTVFPELQAEAQNTLNVSYNLTEIAMYLQDITDDFKKTEVRFLDFDSAIESIVDKWFKKTNQPNPFIPTDKGLARLPKGTVPKEAVEVGGKKKKKSIFATEEKPVVEVVEPTPAPVVVEPMVEPEPVVETQAEFNIEEEKDILLGQISVVEENPELLDDADTMQLIYDQTMAAFSFDEDEAKKWYEENGFDFNKYIK